MKRIFKIGIVLASIVFVGYILVTIEKEISQNRESGYISELGYCEGMTFHVQNYICWNGMLIFDDSIYYMDNGIYKKSDKTISELFGLSTENLVYKMKQCDQYIVMLDKSEGDFLIYDMDSKKAFRHSAYCDSVISDIWYVCNGRIYYMANETLVSMDLVTGDNKKLYSLSDKEMSNDCILTDASSIRDDESVIIAVYHIDTGTSEFKRIEFYADWSVSEMTIGKISPSLYGLLLSDKGYILCNNAEKTVKDRRSEEVIESLAFYDFNGNLLGQCLLPDTDGLDQEYTIEGIIYHDNQITALYVQKDTDELYISQANIVL